MYFVVIAYFVIVSVGAQRNSDVVYLTGYVNPRQHALPVSGTIGSRIPLSAREDRYSHQRNINYQGQRTLDSVYSDEYETSPKPTTGYDDMYRYSQEPEFNNRYDFTQQRRALLNRNGRYYSTQLRLAKSYDYNRYNPSRDVDDYIRYRKRRNTDGNYLKNVSVLQAKIVDFNKYNTKARDMDDYVHYRRKRSADFNSTDSLSVLKANRVQEIREYIYYAPNVNEGHSPNPSPILQENITLGSSTVLQNPADYVLKPIYSTSTVPLSNKTPLSLIGVNGLQNIKKYMYETDILKPVMEPTPQEDAAHELSPNEETSHENEPNNLREDDDVHEDQEDKPIRFRYTSSTLTNSTENIESLPEPPRARIGKSFILHNEPLRLDSEEEEILLHSAFDYPRSIPDEISIDMEDFNNAPPTVDFVSLDDQAEQANQFAKSTPNTYEFPNNLIPDEILPLSIPPTDSYSNLELPPKDGINKHYKPVKRYVKRSRKAKLADFNN